jgi:peptidoglycan hydrolase-like protein with peptidoglycan-binding domain
MTRGQNSEPGQAAVTTRRRVALVGAVTVVCGGLLSVSVTAAGVAGASGPTPPPGPNAVMGFGAASSIGSGARPAGPVSAIVSTPDGNGYWTVSAAGAVTPQGDAVAYGSLVGVSLAAPIVGMASTSNGGGYWLVASDGGIFAFGNAAFLGSMGGHYLAAPIVGMASTSNGGGYWLVASDGGIFAFGNATFHGSMGGHALDEPMVGMAVTPGGGGYWTVASDGGIFSFGDAGFHGSMGGQVLDEPMVSMAPTSDGGGYWMVAADGGIFTFGDAPFVGSGTGGSIEAPAVGMAARPGGYWVAYGQTAPVSSVLGQQEILAILGYLPVAWTPSGFVWRWQTMPLALEWQWVPGAYTVVLRGAITAFEAHVGLPLDGNITAGETAALQAAAANPTAGANPNGYSYALASESLPETLTVWHNGSVVRVSAANTGGAGVATPRGTWPVYERLRAQIMTGTNPGGGHYADPVQYVAYFHGSDAVHYIARATYGSPQSLGCVELPLGNAAIVWPYLTYGTLVTVN